MSFEDIFPLEDEANLGCRIDKFSIGHSGLWIRVGNEKGFLCYLYFTPVEYLSAPIQWFGANFSVASNLECENILRRLGYSQEFATESANRLKLYEVEQEAYKIQIIAGTVGMIDEDILAKK
jgi:hypothetical protein